MTPHIPDNTTAGAPAADTPPHITVDGFDSPIPVVIDLDAPRDGVPLVIETQSGLERCAAAIAAGTGPAGVDAERASGFRYGQRAFLVQIRREGSGTWLIDPEPFENLDIINDALQGVEWILHAASQDLPCLSELGMWPDKLFDTELAARLAGLPRVGLAAVIEQLLGFGLAKEHSAADWSTRPLPEPWLRYAALDVEVLTELREELIELLEADGKLEYAEQEFAAILEPAWPRPGLTRGARPPACTRSATAASSPPSASCGWSAIHWPRSGTWHRAGSSRIPPSSQPRKPCLPPFPSCSAPRVSTAGRPSARLRAGSAASRLPVTSTDLPPLHLPTNAPPPPRVWADRDPEAAARLATARPLLQEKAEETNLPLENLLTPDYLRRIAWRPPAEISEETVAGELRSLGAREWQVGLVAPLITAAFLDPQPLPPKEPKAAPAAQ